MKLLVFLTILITGLATASPIRRPPEDTAARESDLQMSNPDKAKLPWTSSTEDFWGQWGHHKIEGSN